MSEFAKRLIAEGVEQRFHEDVEAEFVAAANAGASDKDIVKRALKVLAAPTGAVMTFASSRAGFLLPIAGTALAYLLETSKLVDKILPGDTRPAVRQAKALIRAAGGAAIIGALSGVRDAAARSTEIDRVIDAARSEPGTPDADLIKEWDMVAVSPQLLPRRAFWVARDGGAIRRGTDNVPVVNHRDWVSTKAMWDQNHKATTKQVGGGKGQQARTERVPAEAFPFELLKLEDAIAQGYFDEATPADIDAIRAMLPKRDAEWWEDVGPNVRHMFLLITRSVRQGTPLQYAFREDHIEDVIGKKGIPFLRDLAEFYNPRATADSRFVEADLEDLVAAFDTVLGSELTSWNKFQRRVSQVWNGRSSLSSFAKAVLYSLFGLLVFFNLASVALFLSAFAGLVVGSLMPYEGPWTFMGTIYAEPKWLAAGLLLGGAIVILIMLFTLRVWQRVMAPIFVGIFNAPKEYLAEFGWRFTFMLLPFFAFVIGALLMESSLTVRLCIVALAGMSIAAGMGYKVSDQFAAASLLTFRGARWGGAIVLAILGLDWVIRAQWPQIAWGGIAFAAKYVWPFLHSQWVASALILFIVLIPGLWVLHRTFVSKAEGTINRFELQRRPPFLATMLVILTAITLAVAVPWFVNVRHEVDPFAVKPAAAATTTPPATPPAPAATTPRPKAGHAHSHSDALDPSRLSDPGQRAYHGQ